MKEILSGCKAEPYNSKECEKRETCRRYQHFLASVYPYQDRFSAHRTCRTDDYPHYLEEKP